MGCRGGYNKIHIVEVEAVSTDKEEAGGSLHHVNGVNWRTMGAKNSH